MSGRRPRRGVEIARAFALSEAFRASRVGLHIDDVSEILGLDRRQAYRWLTDATVALPLVRDTSSGRARYRLLRRDAA